MIARTADVFLRAGVPDLFVVVGKRGDEIVSALSGRSARFLWNSAYEETEMFASVQIGLTAIREEGGFDAAFILPGDMPAIPPELLASLMRELETGGWDVVFPSTGTRRLHPPLVRANCFDRLIAYAGEDGMRGAFREAGLNIGYVVTADAGCLLDADTPEEFARVQEHLSNRSGGEQNL
jgi:CTP:molybdopterin cytidylyltransferase MocA